ncbi:class Ib ribonucleoside-diphosphate reductase assembly flavoprotein NrdI [Arthrobacter sp. ov118]|uniref:class Ib ribonucleoside-diphosphate reductase assembly flavoprotein NrdI n=1 Tax=Arthrobacter sp. ov118 TaxID=1761747 RepID=UPI0008E20489|nr:class Ib ribonucleoside-diphosphate reductase assembly flavoprotein NrdI [Arthrobacter sp. ov118]SFT68598.1 protein involved in ribonucleotide reduction [Arthrobacter sp. ov118]
MALLAMADAPPAAGNGSAAAAATPAAKAPVNTTPPINTTNCRLIYFSSTSENTARFVAKLGIDAARLPLYPRDEPLVAREPYVLVVPTYGGTGGEGSVPKQVIRFLNHPGNRRLIRGVIGAGNTNFGDNYCMAGEIIAAKCSVPHLYRFELMGTPEDVSRVQEGLEKFWTRLSQTPQ